MGHNVDGVIQGTRAKQLLQAFPTEETSSPPYVFILLP